MIDIQIPIKTRVEKTMYLDEIKAIATELLEKDSHAISEVIIAINEALIDAGETYHSESEEKINIDYYFRVLETFGYALDVDPDLNNRSAKLRGLTAMQNELEKIKDEV